MQDLPARMTEAGEEIGDAALQLRLEALGRDARLYNRDTRQALGDDIQKQLSELAALRGQFKDKNKQETLDRTLAHVETIFTHTSVVNTLVETLTWLPIGPWSHALDQAYQRHHQRVQAATEPYERYLYIASAVFVMYVLCLLLWPRQPSDLAPVNP